MTERRKQHGFTLIEALFLMAIVGIVGLGAGIGLQSVSKMPVQTDVQLAINAECVSLMEQMRATPFANLGSKTITQNVTLNGKTYVCAASAAPADADGDGNNDADYAQITVTMKYQNTPVQTLTCCVMQP